MTLSRAKRTKKIHERGQYMTFTYRSQQIGRFSVAIEQEKFENTFHVRAYEEIGDWGYLRKDTVYDDEGKANARFKRLVNFYRKEVAL